MPTPRPSFSWVKQKLEERRSLYSSLHRAWEEDQSYHLWTSMARGALEPYVAGIPEGFELVLLPWGEMAVQTGANRIVAGAEPDVTVVFPDGTFKSYEDPEKEERERRDLYIRWTRACLRRVLGRALMNVARDQAIKLLSLGPGPLMWPLDFHRWPDPPHGGWLPEDEEGVRKAKPLPENSTAAQRLDRARWERQRRDAFPWAVSSPHPAWVFWDPNNDPPRDYILEEEITASDAGEYEGSEASGSDIVRKTRITYLSGDWIGQWSDDQPLLRGRGAVGGVMRNLSVRPPMTVAFSGMGSTDSEASWEQKVKGMIRDGRGIILTLAKSVNFVAAMAETYAFPGYLLRGPEAKRAAAALEMGAGAKTVIEDLDTQVEPMRTPSTPQEAYRLYEMATAGFAAWFGSDVLRGEAQPGEPARSRSGRAILAGMPFEAPKVAMEQAWSLMMVDMTEQVRYVLREAVYVDGVTMRPKDVVEGTQILVDLTPMTEEDKAFRRTAAQDDVKMGVMSDADYIRRERGIDDAPRVLREVAVQNQIKAWMADPEIAAVGKQAIMMKLQTAFGVAPPSMEGMEGEEPPAAEDFPAMELTPPPPTGGSQEEAQQYVNSVSSPVVGLPRQAVQAGA